MAADGGCEKIAPMDAAILDRIELGHSLGALTLYDWMAEEVQDGRNLIRTDNKGHELWRAEPTFFGRPGYEDCFTNVMWNGASLTAYTWSGFRVAIDLHDGAVTVLEFTK